MRDWTLSPGDPLVLTLAADFRTSAPDYTNDHIWELELGGGDPPAVALRTTYGLRARSMRIFPRFRLADQAISDPVAFPLAPRLRRFYPNFMLLDFSPLPGIDVVAEYWVPDSHTVAGRFSITNRAGESRSLFLELCGQLAPIEGQAIANLSMQSVNVLAGRSSDLAPVVLLTGGPEPGPGPYPSLSLDLALPAGGARTLTWAQAALADPEASFELARRIAARPWEAERTRIEMANTADTVEVYTGEPDWDAAFALSQRTALGLCFGASHHLPQPSFVLSRQPDHGHSRRGDGTDYSHLWNGQPALETAYLSDLLPAAPALAVGLLRNFLAVQTPDGSIDCRPGLAGQAGRWLAAPRLADLAWKLFERTGDQEFLTEVLPGLNSFVQCWFDRSHDRDRDGFPEWDHVLQTGFEENPAFSLWQTGGQGADINCVESPALAALLYREIQALSRIARTLGRTAQADQWDLKAEELRLKVEECWMAEAQVYQNRDRETHHSPEAKVLAELTGPGQASPKIFLRLPARLLVRVEFGQESTRHLTVTLSGQNGQAEQSEALEGLDFQWGASTAVATTRSVYTRLDKVEVAGLEATDRVRVSVMDLTGQDITLLLPLWAGIPPDRRAHNLASRAILASQQYGRPFGMPACPDSTDAADSSLSVHLPWNSLICEGLLAYGMRDEAAELVTHLMAGVVQNLKRQRAFAQAYHAENGAPIGERNALQGLAPLGAFLETLGMKIHTQTRLTLSGRNPFPWPVTVKYKGLTVTRQALQTVVLFPDGQTVTLNDPTDAVVSAG